MLKEVNTGARGGAYVPYMNTHFKKAYHIVEKNIPHSHMVLICIYDDAYQML